MARKKTEPSQKAEGARSRQLASPGKALMWLLLTISLLLNLLIINRLLRVQQAALLMVAQVQQLSAELQDETLTMVIPIQQTIIIDADVPIRETIRVPVQTTVAIETEVTVPVDAGILGVINLVIPIETTIPLDLTLDVPIDQSIAIHAPIELDIEVPVEVAIADTPIYDLLEQVQAMLDGLAGELAQ